MSHRVKPKMRCLIPSAIIILSFSTLVFSKSINLTDTPNKDFDDSFDNSIIDFDDEYSIKFNNKYDNYKKDNYKYTFNDNKDISAKIANLDKDVKKVIINDKELNRSQINNTKTDKNHDVTTNEPGYGVIPLELVTTTDISNVETTIEPELTVIPLQTTAKAEINIEIKENVPISTIRIPVSTNDDFITTEKTSTITEQSDITVVMNTTKPKFNKTTNITEVLLLNTSSNISNKTPENNMSKINNDTSRTKNDVKNIDAIVNIHSQKVNNHYNETSTNITKINLSTKTTETNKKNQTATKHQIEIIDDVGNETPKTAFLNKNETSSTKLITIHKVKIIEDEADNNKTKHTTKSTDVDPILDMERNRTPKGKNDSSSTSLDIDNRDVDESDVPVFTELELDGPSDVPEDYYDSKDIIPTKAPQNDALSVIFGLAGSVVESMVESVAERVVPKGIYDLLKRMQEQNKALEAEKLRSREENGGLGQFGRGIIRSITSGISKPLSQLMAGVRDIGSLDTDRGFLNSLASGVTSVASAATSAATSLADNFKDRVQAIYPGTVWCGDGRSAQARSGDLGLFFLTDTCCRQHDACKLYIRSGETKHGLTNTGLFTRSHCSCDQKFRECLMKTNSLVSSQIGWTYFNVLGPQCFRKAHPIVKCVRRTRLTGQKCEEYELDFSKPKMWQWFDNETF